MQAVVDWLFESQTVEFLLGAQVYCSRLGWLCSQHLMQLLICHHCTVLHCHVHLVTELKCNAQPLRDGADTNLNQSIALQLEPLQRRKTGSPQRLGGAKGSRRSRGSTGRGGQRQRLLAVGQPPLHQHAVEHLACRRRAAAATACIGALTTVMRCPFISRCIMAAGFD